MAGTPYWRERKLVTSSSERKPNFTRAEARRAGHPAAETYLSCIPTNSEVHAKPLICRGNQRRSIRTDTNCQPNGHSAKVTSVPVLGRGARGIRAFVGILARKPRCDEDHNRRGMFFGASQER